MSCACDGSVKWLAISSPPLDYVPTATGAYPPRCIFLSKKEVWTTHNNVIITHFESRMKSGPVHLILLRVEIPVSDAAFQ